MGYFIVNFDTHSVRIGGINLEEFVDMLRSSGKNVAVLSPTHRWLSAFDQGHSQLVVFGDQLNLSNPPGTYADLIRYYVVQKSCSLMRRIGEALSRFVFT